MIKPIEFFEAKGNNKRIGVYLVKDEKGDKAFRVLTKTLQSFKDRNILITDNLYSVETFVILKDMFNLMLDNSKVSNKLILKELNKMKKFVGKTSFHK